MDDIENSIELNERNLVKDVIYMNKSHSSHSAKVQMYRIR